MRKLYFAPALLFQVVDKCLLSSAFVPPPSIRRRTFVPSAIKATHVERDFYKPEKVQDEEFDAIVIGSGIGGLTTASFLAQAGKKTLILEQHYVAGGACHTFQSKGYRFATGIHYIGEMGTDEEQDRSDRMSLKSILDSITPLNDPVLWDRMNEHFETVILGDPWSRHEIVANEETLQAKLIERFPKEKRAIKKYYLFVKKARSCTMRVLMFKSLPLPVARILIRTGLHRLMDGGFHKWSSVTLQEVLEKLTKNKDLQGLLAYNWGDYGTEPNRTPFYMHAMTASHFLDGAYYPHGGPSMISKKIIQCVKDNGGKVLVSAPVKRLVLEENTNKATAVEMMDGTIIKAKSIVSNVGLINTVTKLLPPDLINIDFAEDDRTGDELHPGATGINLFVGLKGDQKSLHLPESQYWIYPSNNLVGDAEKVKGLTLEKGLDLDATELTPVFVGIPGSKDKKWDREHPHKSALEIITIVPWHWFEKFANFDKKTRSHGADYDSAKEIIASKMWERVVEVLGPTGAKLPKTLDEVDHFEVGTPLTFSHYYHSQRGAFYGLDHDLKRFEPKTFFLRLRPEVPEIPGLYLTGQDISVSSMCGAMVGGLLCAQKVLGVLNPLSLIRNQEKGVSSDENAVNVPGENPTFVPKVGTN